MSSTVGTVRDIEGFIVEYVVRNGDELEEVRADECITAAIWAGYSEAAVIKARHRIRHRIGSRRAARHEGGGTRWYPLFNLRLLGDSTPSECAETIANQLVAQIADVLPLLNTEQRDRLIAQLRKAGAA